MLLDAKTLDLIGWDLSKALKEMENTGWQAVVNFTCPTRGKPIGRARVIRLTRVAEKKAVVIAARQVLGEGGD